MYKFKKSLFALAGMMALIGAVSLLTPLTGQSQTNTVGPTKPVLVVNSPSEPVPVTGTVNVGNLGDGPLPVRDVDNPARQPVQADAFCDGTGATGCFTRIFEVPPGKRLVIEYASMQAGIPAGQVALFEIQTLAGGASSSVQHSFPLSAPSVSGFGGGLTAVGQQVRVYADPGISVGVAGRRNIVAGDARFNFTISGYLVDVP
jgi:hypothetical protein